ncbi:MAG: GNAT family N-acetyltransferase [Balneolaceae bacterium]
MNIQHEESETKGAFFILNDQNKRTAELTYSKAGADKIIIDHTQISDENRGKSYGKQLVFHAVEFARSNNLKVLPLCPFAQSVFQRFPELNDVR